MDNDLRRALAGGLEGVDEGFDEEEDEGGNWLNDDFVLQATAPNAGQVSSGWEGDTEDPSFTCVRVLTCWLWRGEPSRARHAVLRPWRGGCFTRVLFCCSISLVTGRGL